MQSLGGTNVFELGMKLDTKDGLLLVCDTGKLRVLGGSNDHKVRRQADQFVKVGHEDGNRVSQPGEKPVGMAVDFGDVDVRMTILYREGSEVISHGVLNVTNLVSLREQHSWSRFSKRSPGIHS